MLNTEAIMLAEPVLYNSEHSEAVTDIALFFLIHTIARVFFKTNILKINMFSCVFAVYLSVREWMWFMP